MAGYAKILELNHDSAEATVGLALKTTYHSVRLIKDPDAETGVPVPEQSSVSTNVLLTGRCIDQENRKLYLFYIDNYYSAAWIIEVNIDNRTQRVVYYDANNSIGFNLLHKIHNPRVIAGKIIWTDGNSPIRQIDIERAKNSFSYGIGYEPNANITEWDETIYYYQGQIVSEGKYFYKCLVSNAGLNPTAWTVYWEQLCLIEECYYSMKPENFYFAPMPPLLAPVVTYEQNDSRKINNLRQTLFQFAYNYIYMDWRESTYSPASIVAMPVGEEEVITGKQTEDISKNNTLRISVNTGGEEARMIRIIGRSSKDPSTWYLVEEIEKFSAEEKQYESSKINVIPYTKITITVPLPTITTSGLALPGYPDIALSIPIANVEMYYVISSDYSMNWGPTDDGAGVGITATITAPAGSATVVSKPSWISGTNSTLHPLIPGTSITDGTDIVVYPNSENAGSERTGYLVLTDSYGDLCYIAVTQLAAPVLPTVSLEVHPLDTWSIVPGSSTAINTYVNVGSTTLHISFKAQDLDSPGGVTLAVQILKNGLHLMYDTTIGRNLYQTPDTFTLPVAAAEGDMYIVILDEP